MVAPTLWIRRAPGVPYFVDEKGADWTPVGHNEAITWRNLSTLLRGDIAGVELYLAGLVSSGVTCLRLMLEYAQTSAGLLENPIGCFVPRAVRAWDTLFALCGRHGLRLLLTPFDTFWMWQRWRHHPYNARNGGCLEHPSRMLLCASAREAIKRRLSFAVERWGGGGTLFAWDLWNEIHPGQAEDDIGCFEEFIADLSTHVRRLEKRLYGRSRPQTVSLFGPEIDWRPQLDFAPAIFRHPDLDFASLHIYREGTIDDPRDTVAPALDMAEIVAASLAKIGDDRPFFDSEHGPIHRFKDRRQTLAADFDDEYFRHMQWAHLAAGGAGGGMRWPNRSPHMLTPGMNRAQRALSDFLPLIAWGRFRRRNWSARIAVSPAGVKAVACGDAHQAILWLVRLGPLTRRGMLDRRAKPVSVSIGIPGLAPGRYRVTLWDTREGIAPAARERTVCNGWLRLEAELRTDLALAIRQI